MEKARFYELPGQGPARYKYYFLGNKMLIYALLPLFLLSSPITESILNSADYEALRDLYQSTSGDHWIWIPPSQNSNWTFVTNSSSASYSDPCIDRWQGLVCSADSRVLKLKLAERNLAGGIPSSISKLQNMTFVDFSYNAVSGTIPAAIFAMPLLEELHLHYNSLTGGFPHFYMTGQEQQMNLKKLDISSNKLQGTIPDWITGFSKLAYIRLRLNSFNGSIGFVEKLPNLEYINFRSCSFSGPIPDVMKLKKLSFLAINYNLITGTLPNDIGLLKDLLLLAISGSSLHGCFVHQFILRCACPNLLRLQERYHHR